VASLWFSPGTPVSSINKTDHHDITEIFLKVALNTITPNPQLFFLVQYTIRQNTVKKNVEKQLHNQKWRADDTCLAQKIYCLSVILFIFQI